jgi:hypothetical protein
VAFGRDGSSQREFVRREDQCAFARPGDCDEPLLLVRRRPRSGVGKKNGVHRLPLTRVGGAGISVIEKPVIWSERFSDAAVAFDPDTSIGVDFPNRH